MPASTLDLFGDAPDTSLLSSPAVLDPPNLSSQASTVGDGADDGTGPTILEVLRTIRVNHTDLMGMVAEIKTDFVIMQLNLQKRRGRISDLEDTINPLLPKINTSGRKSSTLENKVDDLENCLHTNNLQLVGLP